MWDLSCIRKGKLETGSEVWGAITARGSSTCKGRAHFTWGTERKPGWLNSERHRVSKIIAYNYLLNNWKHSNQLGWGWGGVWQSVFGFSHVCSGWCVGGCLEWPWVAEQTWGVLAISCYASQGGEFVLVEFKWRGRDKWVTDLEQFSGS
jgi:hypothetical protein